MNATQLEAMVHDAITRLRSGSPVEDDRIEFKREWPGVDKARQLAGAANRSGGDYLIYVVGVDEKTGEVHALSGIDPADWWAQMEAPFDDAVPELLRHINVRLSETETVVALLFRADRQPYVVKVASGGATEREVPIRVGTRTRSAQRHELIRLLYPAIHVPQLLATSASLALQHPGPHSVPDDLPKLTLTAQVYFEHVQNSALFLPLHDARATVRAGDVSLSAGIYYSRATDAKSVPFGVSLRWDGIELTGPGVAFMYAAWNVEPLSVEELGLIDAWDASLEFKVSGIERRAMLDLRLSERRRELDRDLRGEPNGKASYWWTQSGLTGD